MTDPKDDLLYTAWTIIANAGGGDWEKETPGWAQAARRWRDDWHKLLDSGAVEKPQEEPSGAT